MTPKQGNGKAEHHRQWVSIIPYGINEQHPNAYKDILDTVWENRDNLGYAYRILRDGCCDGCSLGTSGMHDWTMEGIHLCAVRLQLLARRAGRNVPHLCQVGSKPRVHAAHGHDCERGNHSHGG